MYNLYISTQIDTYNILGLTVERLNKVVESYRNGDTEFTLEGKKYWIKNIHEIKIFTHEREMSPSDFKQKVITLGQANQRLGGGYYLSPKILAFVGKDVTNELLGDSEFGEKLLIAEKKEAEVFFIDPTRIDELTKIASPNFDLTRLIKFCKEINVNYSNENFLSVAMLGRSIINHVPPIFGFATFNEVANNYGGSSFKKVMNHLNITMRNIADSFLHDIIRKKETLPNGTQVNFSRELDVLLAEVVRKLSEK